MSVRVPVLVAVAWALSGCGGAMSSAQHAYDEARYPDAIAELEQLEPESAEFSARELARYQLYRGLTHLSLGDVEAANHYLSLAKAAWEHDPSVFDARERGRLLSGWRSMGRMPGERGTTLAGLPPAEY